VIASLKDVARLLNEHHVEYILVGGWAAALHGSARSTTDIDFVYRRSPANCRRLAASLSSFHPSLRGAPKGLPFRFDEATILAGLNFTLTTDLGHLDFFGEIAGGGNYEALLPYSTEVRRGDLAIRCVTLERLIQLKRAAGRPKDFEAIAELQAILDEIRRKGL
jgi:predicted nucleotidyltransferase